ncbi:hypothetical protein CRE_16072 [Caenorhabditis remanei]|uniref:Serpentine receptor class r-10 n=1 Tax=Caenorhabditis remanei TaxID=31234 RepID=E3MBN6_CAERE|nr:hypothetical protein CRE_16072 [Caenorhabditis remanei]
MPLFVQVILYSGFISSEVTNLVLLWLIVTKSSSSLGSYKYIMMSYAVFSIVYGVIDIMTQPITHVSGACLFIYVDSFLKYEKSISLVLVGLYCATFGSCILLLAIHFVYRFFAICRTQDLHRFQGANLLLFYTIPVTFSILWFFTITFLMAPSDLKSEYMRNSIAVNYFEDTSKIAYTAILYYHTNLSGQLVINWLDFAAAFFFCGVMQICIIIMSVCGWKIYRKMKQAEGLMSEKTKELNSQLFRTLILQTLIPLCTMFAPVGIVIIIPMFSIDIGKFSNAPVLYTGFYPALDALIVIFMIRDYRNAVLCRKPKKILSTVVQPGARHSYASSD